MVLGSSETNSITLGYLYGAIEDLVKSCSSATFAGSGRGAFAQHHVGLHDHAAARVGRADDGHLDHVRVTEQRLFDLGPGDVVAGRDDHVVAARLVPEVAVRVADVGIAGDVPAVLHVGSLALVGQVAAAGRALHREPPGLAVGHFRPCSSRIVAR